MARLILRRSPLAFPGGGASAGFDFSHPAAPSTIISAVSMGASFKNLAPPPGSSFATIAGSTQGAVAAIIDGTMGGAINFPIASTVAQVNFSTVGDTPANAVTLATISKMNSFPSFGGLLACADNGFRGMTLGQTGGQLQIFSSGNSLNWAPPLSLNVPYFVVASNNQSTVNWGLRNLQTGQIYTNLNQTGFVLSATIGGTTPTLGNAGFNATQTFDGAIATAMMSWGFLNSSQTLQWLADPWAFWYQPKYLDIFPLGAGGSGGGGLPLMGQAWM
jgi:hypothetical protein